MFMLTLFQYTNKKRERVILPKEFDQIYKIWMLQFNCY